MEKINIIGILIMIFVLPLSNAHEEPVDPGVTPDSFLWGLDKAIDQLNLVLTFSPAEKAKKGIEIARERLEEVKVMVEANKLEAAEKGKEEHIKILSKVKGSISGIEEENSVEQIEKEIEIERELEEHEDEVEEVSNSLKIKIEVKGNLNEQQKALFNSILNTLENKTGELKIEIKNKKDKTKIKIKTETGKSEKEVEEEIEDIEEKIGLTNIKKEKAEEEIEDAKESLEELEKELQEHKLEGHIANETPITILIDNAKEKISKAEEALQSNGFGEAFGQANAAKQIIENAERILDKTVEKFEEGEEEHEMKEREIEVEIEDGEAEIKIKIGDSKLKFTMQTTDKNSIIQEISARIGLNIEEVAKLAEFKGDVELGKQKELEEIEEKVIEGTEEEKEVKEKEEVESKNKGHNED